MEALYDRILSELVAGDDPRKGFAALFTDAALNDLGYNNPAAARVAIATMDREKQIDVLEQYVTLAEGQLKQQYQNRDFTDEEIINRLASQSEEWIYHSLFVHGAQGTRHRLDDAYAARAQAEPAIEPEEAPQERKPVAELAELPTRIPAAVMDEATQPSKAEKTVIAAPQETAVSSEPQQPPPDITPTPAENTAAPEYDDQGRLIATSYYTDPTSGTAYATYGENHQDIALEEGYRFIIDGNSFEVFEGGGVMQTFEADVTAEVTARKTNLGYEDVLNLWRTAKTEAEAEAEAEGKPMLDNGKYLTGEEQLDLLQDIIRERKGDFKEGFTPNDIARWVDPGSDTAYIKRAEEVYEQLYTIIGKNEGTASQMLETYGLKLDPYMEYANAQYEEQGAPEISSTDEDLTKFLEASHSGELREARTFSTTAASLAGVRYEDGPGGSSGTLFDAGVDHRAVHEFPLGEGDESDKIRLSSRAALNAALPIAGDAEFTRPLEFNPLTQDRQELRLRGDYFFNPDHAVGARIDFSANAAGNRQDFTLHYHHEGFVYTPEFDGTVILPGSRQTLGDNEYRTLLGAAGSYDQDRAISNGNQISFGADAEVRQMEITSNGETSTGLTPSAGGSFAFNSSRFDANLDANAQLIDAFGDDSEAVFTGNARYRYSPTSNVTITGNQFHLRSSSVNLDQVGLGVGIAGQNLEHTLSADYTSVRLPETGFRPAVNQELLEIGYNLSVLKGRFEDLEVRASYTPQNQQGEVSITKSF